MGHCSISIILLFSLLYLQICYCTQNSTQLLQEERNSKAVQLITTRLKTFWTWIQEQAKSEDTFIGRCAGGFKKMKMAMNFIIFKLGVIVTSLGFLSALTFKGLGLGVAILVISAIGLFSKLFAQKHGGETHGHSGAVHLHIHNKGGSGGGGGGGGYYHDHGWYDRFDRVMPKNDLERNAVADLYKRLGIEPYERNGISIR
ncbi:hypothetical protein ILUMI_01166 [Ignelater luminosus]|uniref:Uncharacterized protein n=1 Tax=Ignelater luminosus TaxID=2038154 RepID=A0A8K0GLZ0_IGNLU|nr:hypothetical protein ILUMI_01166 [Ignelater luminosus]